MEKMEHESKMKQVTSTTVIVIILDPMGQVTFNQFENNAKLIDAIGGIL